MRGWVRRLLVVGLAVGTAGLAGSSATAFGEGSTSGAGTGASPSLSGPLVTPGSPTEGEQVQAQEEAKRSSPEAVAKREESRTKYSGLNTERATNADGETFSAVIDEPAGGSPKLPAGQSITGYPTDDAAQVDLGEGRRGVVESTAPMAIESSPGQRTPVDLSLNDVGNAFEPKTPLVPVRISGRVGEGVALSGVGVSLTPVDAQGAALGGSEGTVDGASVLYANTQTDADTVVKPTELGFEVDTMLRAIDSPRQLYFKVGLPAGASLVQAQDGSGAVEVVKEGVTIATIPSPGAQDASGMSVPVSMSVSGDTLVLSVGGDAEEERFPVEVDPEVEWKDPELVEKEEEVNGKKVKMRSNWEFKATSEAKFGHEPDEGPNHDEGHGKGYLQTTGTASYSPTETAAWFYQTRGESKISEFKALTEGQNKGAEIESFLELEHSGGSETKVQLSTELKNPEYGSTETSVCAKNGSETKCLPPTGTNGNAIRFEQSVQATPSNYKFLDRLTEGYVYLWEPAGFHATAAFNTTSPELKGKVINEKGVEEEITRKNVLDGGGWLTKKNGALGLISEDKGIGVSATRLEYENAPGKWEKVIEHNYIKEGDCKGVQCEPKNDEFWVTEPKLPNGEDKIRYRSEEAMPGTESLESESKSNATVKVETAKPHGLFLGGLPYGNELSERAYKLTAYATDGEGSTVVSPGVASIEVEVNNREGKKVKLAIKNGTGTCSVSKGECTASAEYELNGAEIGAGHHGIVIKAKDNAGNEAVTEEEVTVRHSTPVTLGPGSVDLESGEFSLGATDVSMGSGLTVSRDSSSRNVSEGDIGPDNGPLGPEWSMSLGTTESLVEIADKSILLTDSTGKQTIFAKTKTATYESPPGDSNLKLTVEENKEKTEKLAFYLEDPAAKTKVKFTLPTGSTAKIWRPTKQEGAVATDTVSYAYQAIEQNNEHSVPEGASHIIAGPDGNLWYTAAGSKIGKMTTWGAVTEYRVPELGSELHVNGITSGPESSIWFTVENGYTGTGSATVGSVTTTGEFKLHYLPTGSGPAGITPGPDGNLWFTDQRSNKIGKITTSGAITEYSLPAGREPYSIVAGPDGNLWFTENLNSGGVSGIGKITTSGTITEYSLAEGTKNKNSGPNAITVGSDGNLWFSEENSSRIGKITTSGAITEYSIPSGSISAGITTGPEGNLWFVEREGEVGNVGKMTTSGALTEYPLPKDRWPDGITTGSDGNMWIAELFGHDITTLTTSGKHPTIIAPTEELAPVPSGVSCAPTMNPGCRALKFTYSKATTASGEGKSGWGEYEGHLKTVSLTAYNPAPGHEKMEETPVAEYSYDNQGRLRAEWDPRTSPALKTTYGYDFEDHVTALDPPGQEPWTFTYSTIAGDAGSGRLVKATRAPASEALWGGSLPANTEAPKITGSLVVGNRLAVSTGKWSGSPISYSYRWMYCTFFSEDCAKECPTSPDACTPIPGANNANYVPVIGDAKDHTLVVAVTATNGGGTTTVTSNVTGDIKESSKIEVGEKALATESRGYEITQGPDGNLWFTDDGANKIGKFAPPVGAATEYALPTGSNAHGITAGPGGESALWFTDYGTSKIGKITTSGTITEYALPSGSDPSSIVVGPDKNLWFTDYGTGKIGKITTSGTITEYSIKVGKPYGITAGPDGNLWFTNGSTPKIGKITTSGTVTEYWLPKEKGHPHSIVAGPDGNLWFTIPEAEKIGKATTSGSITEYSLPSESKPAGITAGPEGESALWFTDSGTDKVGTITTSGTITEYAVPHEKSDPLGIATASEGTLWFTEETNDAVGKVGGRIIEGELHSPGPGTTIDYGVPLEGAAAPEQMGTNETTHRPEPEKWGQKAADDPVEATAIFPPDSPEGWPASSYKRATTYYLNEEGRNVNVAQPSTSEYGSISTTEYNEENDVIRTLGPDDRVAALKETCESEAKCKSEEVAKLLSTVNVYNEPSEYGEPAGCRKETGNPEKETAEPGTRLCETWGPEHEVKYVPNGYKTQTERLARNHVKYYYEDIKNYEEIEHKAPPEGEKYDLVTETQDLAQTFNSEGKEEEEVESRRSTTSYSGQGKLGWELRAPTSTVAATESEGAKVEHKTLYVESGEAKGQIKETRGPKGLSGESAHDSMIVYYTAEADKEGYKGCGEHPEWAGLVCVTAPKKQPAETANVSRLPVTSTVAYNMWDEPEKVEETFEKTATMPESKRTKVEAYDPAGRLLTSETTSTSTKDASLPKVTDEYSSSTGVLEKQSTTVSEKTKTIASKFNKLGQLTEYTDADGNVAKYKYAGPENDGLLEEVSDSSDKGESTQKYKYNETTKEMTELVDSAAGVFTASYDTEGALTSEVYPNGMCANDSYNAVGEAVGIEYVKSSNCAEKSAGVWFSESRVPSVRGETMSRTSTLASETYGYDTLGRPTETQETPAGEYCKTRVYKYDEESNREKLTKYEPNSKKECTTTEGGTVEEHKYDEANRLIDSGIEYDPLGNVTKLPAADAEGHELKSTFYVDNAVATQEQNGTKNEYFLDPDGRVRETVTGAKKVLSHYDGAGEAVAWTCEVSSTTKECEAGTYTRNIPGIGGTLAAVQTNSSGVPVLQLHDLEGDICATIKDKTGETKLESTYNSTEFGVPNAGKAPPSFAWLGAGDVQSSLPSGVITYGSSSYVPQTALALQSEQVERPGYPVAVGGGTYATFTAEPWVWTGALREAKEAPGIGAAEQKEAEEAAAAAAAAACSANPAACPQEGGGGYAIGEIDPSDNGKWGHLHVTLTGGICYGEGEGCKGEFSLSASLTEKNGRKSRMVLRVVLEFDGERAELQTYEAPGEGIGPIKTTIDIPNDAILYFYLDVWVGGKKDGLIEAACWVEEGQITF